MAVEVTSGFDMSKVPDHAKAKVKKVLEAIEAHGEKDAEKAEQMFKGLIKELESKGVKAYKAPSAPKKKAPKKPVAKKAKKKTAKKAPKSTPATKQSAESIKSLIAKLKKEPRYKGKLSDSTYPPNSSRSLKKDSKQVALPPGKRISKKTGKVYYEGRMNRADIDKTIRLEKGGSLSGANYIPAYEVEKIVMKSGKVIDLMSDPLTLVSGVRYTPTGSAFTSKIAQNQLALFGFGGKLSDKAKYYTREEIDHVVTDHAGIIQGNQIYNGMWLESDMISERQKMLLDQYVESQKRRKGLEVDVVVRKTDKDPWEFIKKDISRDEAEKIVAKAKKSGKYHAVMINDLPFGAGGVLAGTIIGAYLGYKVGRSQEKSDDVFKTEKKAVSKAKAKVKEHRARKKVPAMAKGGVTKHGLQRGDTIVDDIFWKNKAKIKDKDGKTLIVDIDKGKRNVKYANGGEIEEKLVKELNSLQRQLNSSRLQTYIEGDTSEEAVALKRERASKLRRFNEILEVLNKKSMAKGGKVDKWIQKADKEMEKEGTVGAFTKQAKRVGMTPVAFAKKVLANSKDYTKRTRERAQFVKNTNPEKFKGGGKIDANWGSTYSSDNSEDEDYNKLYALFPDNWSEAKEFWGRLSKKQQNAFENSLSEQDAANEHIAESWMEFVNAPSEKHFWENETNWDEEEYAKGGEVKALIEKGNLVFGKTSKKHSDLYGIEANNPLFIQRLCIDTESREKGLGRKAIEHIESYAKQNNHDLIFGHIATKSKYGKEDICNVEKVKSWMKSSGYNIAPNTNDFYKKISDSSTYADGGAIKKERKYTSKQDHEQKYKSKRKSPVVSYKKAPKEEEEHGDGWGIDFLNLFN